MNQKNKRRKIAQAWLLSTALLLAPLGLASERPDFIEAQVRFSETVTPSCIYWQEIQVLEVHLQLEWTNFEKDLHDGGFDLNRAKSSDLIYPLPPENCAFERSSGVLAGPLPGQGNYVSLAFRGPSCLEMAERLNLGTIAIHHYEVPALAPQTKGVQVLRLQIWDHLPNLVCQSMNLPSI